MVSGNILQTEAWVTNNSRALVSVSGLSLKKNPPSYFSFHKAFVTVSTSQLL